MFIPPESKSLTDSQPIMPLAPPEKVVVPIAQHIGAPAKPVVNKKDEVKLGQVIAEAGGFVSVPIHSPVSGKVTKVEDYLHPVSGYGLAIFIDNDGQDTPHEDMKGVGEIFPLFT